MIKQIDVVISFPLGASFTGNLNIDVYRRLIAFIKDLMCFNIQTKCKDCIKNKQCRYYQMVGNNFSDYPGILIKNNLFDKRHFKQGEQKEFTFYFIGNNEMYLDYVELFFDQLNQLLFQNMFYLNSIQIKELENRKVKINGYCSTPIEIEDFNASYNKMVLFYNAVYETSFDLMIGNNLLQNIRKISWDPIKLKTRKIYVKGYVGKISLENVDERLLNIGIGKYNYLGGGYIEIEN